MAGGHREGAARGGATTRTASRRRVTKDPAVRREELLDLAFSLCRSEGFDAMSVDQLTRVAGVAKGTFYHYFSSKDDLLEQLVHRFGDALFDLLSAAANATEGSGTDRLRALMGAAAAYKMSQADVGYAGFLYRPENLPLRHRLMQAWRERARQVLLPVIAEGAADGSMSVADVGTATDLVLLLWFDAPEQLSLRAFAAPDADTFAEVMLAGAVAIYQAQERILGLPDGTFVVPADPQLVELTRQLYTLVDRKQ